MCPSLSEEKRLNLVRRLLEKDIAEGNREHAHHSLDCRDKTDLLCDTSRTHDHLRSQYWCLVLIQSCATALVWDIVLAIEVDVVVSVSKTRVAVDELATAVCHNIHHPAVNAAIASNVHVLKYLV